MNRISSIIAVSALSLVIGFIAVAPPSGEAIVGGTVETDNKFSWLVNVAVGGNLSCRGVLIAPTWVLTAAHCIGSFKNGGTVSYTRTNPVTGVTTKGSQNVGLNSSYTHPDYKPGFPDDDIALVRLPAPFPSDPLLQVANLPSYAPTPGQKGTVASSNLTAGQLTVLRGAIGLVSSKKFTAQSATASVCSGDSGSGFMTLKYGINVVTGIVSQGAAADCAPNQEFDVVDVFAHSGWIYSVSGVLSNGMLAGTPVNADYDGDGKMDIAVKTSQGDWKIDFASNGYGFWDVIFPGYGGNEAYPVPADYDGDGKADISVRTNDGIWYIDLAANGFGAWDKAYLGYGGLGTIPVPADYDGDGKADLSIKTTGGVWYIDYAKDGFGAWNASYGGYGGSDFTPVPRDYDGDHKADLSAKTTGGMWYIDYAYAPLTFTSFTLTTSRTTSSTSGFGSWNVSFSGYGGSDAHPVPADYDGDGKADLAVKTDGGRWYIDFSSNGFGTWDFSSSGWGGNFSYGVPGDYDGDHKADLAVYYSLTDTWFIDLAKDGFNGVNMTVAQTP